MTITRQSHSHYLGKNDRGIAQYTAHVCGHIVSHPETKSCRKCAPPHRRPGRSKINPRYLRSEGGQSIYRADCGHEVRGIRSRNCRPCATKAAYDREDYKRVKVDGKQCYEHRVIAEKALGRPLKFDEVVHHINMNTRDNRNCNLLVCTREYHTQLHARMEQAYGEQCNPPLPQA